MQTSYSCGAVLVYASRFCFEMHTCSSCVVLQQMLHGVGESVREAASEENGEQIRGGGGGGQDEDARGEGVEREKYDAATWLF